MKIHLSYFRTRDQGAAFQTEIFGDTGTLRERLEVATISDAETALCAFKEQVIAKHGGTDGARAWAVAPMAEVRRGEPEWSHCTIRFSVSVMEGRRPRGWDVAIKDMERRHRLTFCVHGENVRHEAGALANA